MTESKDNLNTAVPAEGPAKPKQKGRKVFVTAIVVLSVLLLLLCGVAIWGYTLSVSDRNLPKVTIDSIPVGGAGSHDPSVAGAAALRPQDRRREHCRRMGYSDACQYSMFSAALPKKP